jgi:hypothetical protein
MTDDRLAGKIGEHLAGKANSAVTGWYDGDDIGH